MRVIPVLDVKRGIAVRAVAGRREEYKPLRSSLCPSPDPLEVARSFEREGFGWLYVADLDAIEGGPLNARLLEAVKEGTRLELLVDAGVRDSRTLRALLETGADAVVIGTETLLDLGFLASALDACEELLVSLDTREGRVISPCPDLADLDPARAAELLESLGISEIIALDLSRVGTKRGPNLELVESIVDRTGLSVIAGGGVRSLADLVALREVGASGALVATVLHDLSVRARDLARAGFEISPPRSRAPRA